MFSPPDSRRQDPVDDADALINQQHQVQQTHPSTHLCSYPTISHPLSDSPVQSNQPALESRSTTQVDLQDSSFFHSFLPLATDSTETQIVVYKPPLAPDVNNPWSEMTNDARADDPPVGPSQKLLGKRRAEDSELIQQVQIVDQESNNLIERNRQLESELLATKEELRIQSIHQQQLTEQVNNLTRTFDQYFSSSNQSQLQHNGSNWISSIWTHLQWNLPQAPDVSILNHHPQPLPLAEQSQLDVQLQSLQPQVHLHQLQQPLNHNPPTSAPELPQLLPHPQLLPPPQQTRISQPHSQFHPQQPQPSGSNWPETQPTNVSPDISMADRSSELQQDENSFNINYDDVQGTSSPVARPASPMSLNLGAIDQIFPSGSHRPFLGNVQPPLPQPSARPSLKASRATEFVSRTEPEPESTWTEIPPTPFHQLQFVAWRQYKKGPKRPIPAVSLFTEYVQGVELPFDTTLPQLYDADGAGMPINAVSDEYLRGLGLSDSQLNNARVVDALLDRWLRLAYGGRSADATRNPHRMTPYGMPTATNKSSLKASKERYRAETNARPAWERYEWNEIVRNLLFHFLRISNIKQVRLRAPVPVETRIHWELHKAPEPSLQRLQFDWVGGTKSVWNTMMLNKLFELLRAEHSRLKDIWNLPWYSDQHIQVILLRKFETLAKEWKKGLPKPGETHTECLDRLNLEQDIDDKRNRQNVRRIHKFNTRVHITTCNVDMRKAALEELRTRRIDVCSDEIRSLEADFKIWMFAKDLIQRLGEGGMSSEESCEEEDKVVFRVKLMLWRRRMEKVLRLIDRQWRLDPTIYTQRGFKGADRMRIPEGTLEEDWRWKTRRIHQDGLPEVLYDPDWLQNITGQRAVISLNVSRDEFQYFELLTTTQ